MNKKLAKIMIVMFLAVLDWSCEDTFLPVDRNELIVEGWIEAGTPPVVIVTRSLPVRLRDDGISMDHLQDYVEKWAKVTVSDGDTSVVLAGGRDSRFVPGYTYTTGGLFGEKGKTYTLTVEAQGRVVNAVTTIPMYPPSVDSVVINRRENDPQFFEVKALVSNNPDRKEYFKSFYLIGSAERQWLSSFLGVVDDALTDSVFEMPIIRGVSDYDKSNDDRYFPSDTLVSIKIAAVDSISYEIWKSIEDNSKFRSMFMSTSVRENPTNIQGGLGYWCGYNSFIKSFLTK